MSESEVNLFEYVDRLRRESKEEHIRLHERISNMKDELLSEIKEMRKEQIEINQKMDDRVTKLERWKWTIVGGAIVIGFILAMESIRLINLSVDLLIKYLYNCNYEHVDRSQIHKLTLTSA